LVRMLSTPGATGSANAAAARPADPGNAARRQARWWALLLVAGWLCQAGLRAWFSRAQTVPLANPDEPDGGSSPPTGPEAGSPGVSETVSLTGRGETGRDGIGG
jgi:hypothetical protein